VKKKDLIYIAGAIEHRGTIINNPLRVSLRTDGPLPKQLQKEFGGTVFKHWGTQDLKKRKSKKPKNWFRVQNENAEKLLIAILPFLRLHKKRVARFLTKNGAT